MQTIKANFNVKRQFKKYHDTILYIQVMQNNKKELEEKLRESDPSCIQTLSDMPRGSDTSDSTPNTVFKREELKMQIYKTEIDILRNREHIETIECLIATQQEEDRELLTKRIKDKKRWEAIQCELYSKYRKYTHFKSVERRYNDLVDTLQKKMDQIGG